MDLQLSSMGKQQMIASQNRWDDHALMAIDDDDKCIAYGQASTYEAINQSMNNKQHTL